MSSSRLQTFSLFLGNIFTEMISHHSLPYSIPPEYVNSSKLHPIEMSIDIGYSSGPDRRQLGSQGSFCKTAVMELKEEKKIGRRERKRRKRKEGKEVVTPS